MPINNCRICNNKFSQEALLRYKNMPKAAQFLPDKEGLEKDKGIDLEVYQCSACGLVQLSNDPVPYYKEVIRAVAVSEEMKDFRKKQFSDWVEKFSLKGKKIIEIGSGKGEYLSIMQQSGADAYGLEPLDDPNGFSQGPFDGFYILNYLEHLPDPNLVLRTIYNNLTDGAIGLVEVPNFDMILQNKLFSEFTSDHLFYFTKEALSMTLMLNGFEIIECNEVWHDYIISAVVKKRGELDLSHFHKYQEQLKKEIEEYISRFNKIAIWGAGHQALAIISLMNLADKIKYVVDSAPFKQDKYTPATHIPIVSPDLLDSDPVDAVIVMAASYSDEVARTIREKFDKNINITILRDSGLEEIK